MRSWILFLFFAVFSSLSGCATLPVLLPETPPPELLLDQVRARLKAIEGLKGLAQVKVTAAAKNFSAQQVFFVRRPALLRAETLGPLGTPQFYIVTDGRELNLYHPGENRYYRGQATGSHLFSALPVALEPEEVVALLLGGPLLIDFDTASVRRHREESLWALELVSVHRQERQVLWVNPFSFQIIRAEFHRPDLFNRMVFEDFRQFQGLLFPQKIQFTSFTPKAQLTVEYSEVELNPRWEEQDFKLPVPRGATVIPLQ
ncbi:MAG: DUF4292 domain-containing protein [Thermodesulfobacteriota bacterium]|nr:DUF4292 domain-containing protein [Thermodesulfobacteriota bacterium]